MKLLGSYGFEDDEEGREAMERHRRAAEQAIATGRSGYFVDEIYTEDPDEAERLADEEALRSSAMLGKILLVASGLFILAIAAWILLAGRG